MLVTGGADRRDDNPEGTPDPTYKYSYGETDARISDDAITSNSNSNSNYQ